ncbi:50S ribosomal protein L18 [bacterium]|nr:50S ribosomal protein L18 [bacterium]
MAIKRTKRRARIKKSIRKKIHGSAEIPRMSVFRSLKSIYTQLVDDNSGKTILSVSSLSKSLATEIKGKTKTEVAQIVGKATAEEAKKHKIEKVVFDRNGFLYHGRIKAVADGAREAGLKF